MRDFHPLSQPCHYNFLPVFKYNIIFAPRKENPFCPMDIFPRDGEEAGAERAFDKKGFPFAKRTNFSPAPSRGKVPEGREGVLSQ